MQPTFENYEGGFGADLVCPACGGTYLHHERVEVFERNEDERSGLHVAVADGQALVDTALEGNPSGRRHGLSIHFWCEACAAKPVLTIAQHKGNTLVDFRSATSPAPSSVRLLARRVTRSLPPDQPREGGAQ